MNGCCNRYMRYRLSMTPVPTSMRDVRAPATASSGTGEAAWRATWWTRQ
ncbi:hypothetical protein QU670_11880 [Actinomyces massiliensis]|nr:hypothetical protein [Actinomyces massiliensis]WLD71146.1 hypothetical protein QU670_11880 [Actinomyces massiliensis]